jgi:membrane-associated phospholipid phosphatase
MLDRKVIDNFKNVKLGLSIPPFCFLFLLACYFFIFNEGENYIDGYINIQEDLFFYLNGKLSAFPNLQFNLTQLGDVLIFFPLVTIFIIYAPKFWEALLISAVLSLVVSAALKKLFAVPRPAAMFDNESFVIIGETLLGRTSLPSGHSIAAFIVITILLFAFMPKKNTHKISWSLFIIALGFAITISRVGVGAHYPVDVVIGSTIGYIIAIFGIHINNKLSWWSWVENKKYYPIFMLLFVIWGGVIVTKILANNLPIFYLSLFSLVMSLYLITSAYVQEKY